MKFHVEYANGKLEVVEQSDCETVEQFINCKFGRGVVPEAKVTLVGAEAEAEPAVQEEKPKKGKK